MMKDQEIRSILQDALEDEIPSKGVHLWPAVKASLVAGKHQQLQQGVKMNTTKQQWRPRFAFAILVVAALIVAVLATPQGRSFAQSIVQFFVRTESKTFPLPSSWINTEETDTAVPTAQPPSPWISVAQAEAQVGFEIAELPFVPNGFNYLGARRNGNTVSIEYEAQGMGGHLAIYQSLDGYFQSDWEKVPAEAIIPVKIGGLDGEFVQGVFVVFPEETVATWNPDAPILRLRWEKDGVWFEIDKFGDVEVIEYLDQAGLIELAESLSVEP